MATGPITQISDVVVPEVFTPYVQQLSEEKSRLIQAGVLTRDAMLDQALSGGGLTFNVPSFKDLDNESERVSTDGPGPNYTGGAAPDPLKTGTSQEIAVRLSRNNSWSSADLTASLAGADPMASIGARVANYWARRLQAAFVATMNGVIADNVANDSGDYVNDVSGASYTAGVTDFSAEAFLDAALTMGDSMEDLVAVMVHSVVYNRMQKNNLIDFIPDAEGRVTIPTFLGRPATSTTPGSSVSTLSLSASALRRFRRRSSVTPMPATVVVRTFCSTASSGPSTRVATPTSAPRRTAVRPTPRRPTTWPPLAPGTGSTRNGSRSSSLVWSPARRKFNQGATAGRPTASQGGLVNG